MACAAPQDPADFAHDAASTRASGHDQKAFLLIDTVSARVEEANAAGRRLVGIPLSCSLPAALDSAMPALQRLREIADGQNPLDRETLTFWSNGRLSSFTCSVKPVNANGSKHLMQLMELDRREPETAEPAGTLPADRNVERVPAEEALPPVKPRDDAETLREIARRIREGQRSTFTVPAGASSRPQAQPMRPEPPSGTLPAAADSDVSLVTADPAALARLAHELKTPLSAIVAASEIMRDQRLGPMGNGLYLGYAGDIHESALHALAVITNMLEAAESPASRKFQNFDLNALASATVSAMQPLAHARGLTLEHECDQERLELNADPTAIRQILFNLLTNATKFTNAGGAVHAGTGYLSDGSIYLVVRDTGEGMDEDILARAFNEDADTRVRRPGGGYGFGLPMVRRLAESNSGEIEIDSAPGKGTVVLVSFPTRR